MTIPLIELSHCSLILDDHVVLDDVNFALRRGERWALLGPNGAGKSMLLKMLRGDIWPTPTGREQRIYRLEGEVSREPAGSKELIAYVGPERQDKYVRYDWNLTVTQVVTTGLFDEDIPLSRPTRAQRDKVDRILRRFSLWGLRNRHILSLSYGQRRLTLVARAFASPARVLLLDEVFNGLDARAKEKLKRALEQPRSGHDWVISSHRPVELPRNLTHVARIEAGRIIAAGPAKKELLAAKQVRQSNQQPATLVAPRTRRKSRGSSWLVRITKADIYRDYRPVIRNLNWTLHRGENWAVLGANGSGKSTLLSMIYGDLHPALGGSIERDGVPRGTRIENWKRRVSWLSPELQASYFRGNLTRRDRGFGSLLQHRLERTRDSSGRRRGDEMAALLRSGSIASSRSATGVLRTAASRIVRARHDQRTGIAIAGRALHRTRWRRARADPRRRSTPG